MRNFLAPLAPPSLPLSRNQYEASDQEHYSRVLRLFFTRLLDSFNRLVGLRGGQYLNFPYGSFSLNTNQTASTIDTPYTINLDTVDYVNGMAVVNGSEITVEQTGLYNLQFSIQFSNNSPNVHDIGVWVRKNGVDVPATASAFSIPGKHGSVPGSLIGAANFFVVFEEGDRFSMAFVVSSTDVYLHTWPAQTVLFTAPSSPAVVITLTFISNYES